MPETVLKIAKSFGYTPGVDELADLILKVEEAGLALRRLKPDSGIITPSEFRELVRAACREKFGQ